MKNWYVFYCQFKHEKRVHDQLNKMGYQSYVPLMRLVKQWSDRKKIIEVPFFPCYVFVHCREQQVFEIMTINGIVKCVLFGGERARISEREINLLRDLEAHPDIIEVTGAELVKGGTIQITSGVFTGKTGEIVENNKNGILVLLIELFGMKVVTKLQNTQFIRVA